MVLTISLRWLVAACATAMVLGAGLIGLTAAPAQAATLQQVSSFGSNPGALAMYSYRPDGLPAKAPVVVLLHGCTQDATTFFTNSGWRKYADQHAFALVLPQQSTANNSSKCFNWFQSGDVTRGQGEAASIASMVDYAVTTYGSDAARAFVSGLSGGGAMTAVMLAAYPDKFAAGSIDAGIPYGCATSVAQAYTCMSPGVDKTPAAWGDLARSAYAGYSGPRPRVAIWQGQSDTTVAPVNGVELRDQFTDVLGVSQAPTSSGSLAAGTTWEEYGAAAVRLYRIAGMGHGTPVDPGSAANQCGTAGAYFLDTVCAAYSDVTFFRIAGGGGSTATTTTATPTATTTTATPTATITTATTSTTTTSPPACVTSSNYAHVTAGRAYASGGYAYAVGSRQLLGLNNTFYSATLRQSSPGYWEKC